MKISWRPRRDRPAPGTSPPPAVPAETPSLSDEARAALRAAEQAQAEASRTSAEMAPILRSIRRHLAHNDIKDTIKRLDIYAALWQTETDLLRRNQEGGERT
jgi:hypothetical protein